MAATLVVIADTHIDLYPRIPRMFADSLRVWDAAANRAVKEDTVLLDAGDLLDPQDGTIEGSLLDPTYDMIEQAIQVRNGDCIKILGNHAHGNKGTGDHMELVFRGIKGMHVSDDVTSYHRNIHGLDFAFYALPYMEDKEAWIAAVKQMGVDADRRRNQKWVCVLLGHQGFAGAWVGPEEPGYRMKDDDAWVVPDKVFAPFHLALFGHYHKAQTFMRAGCRVMYVGSPMQHNQGDRGVEKGYLVMEINRKGDVLSAEQVGIGTPVFDTVRLTKSNLAKELKVDYTNTYLQATICDPSITLDDLAKFRTAHTFRPLYDIVQDTEDRLELTEDAGPGETIEAWVNHTMEGLPGKEREALAKFGWDLFQEAKEAAKAKATVIQPGRVEFVSVSGSNYRSYKEFSISLDKNGATAICGRNGHGKSWVRRAIRECLFGADTSPDKMVHRWAKKEGALLQIDLTVGGVPYVIRRGRKHSELDNNVVVTSPSIPDSDDLGGQQKINELLGISKETFDKIICIQGAVPFASKKFKDADKKALVEEVLGLERTWEDPYQYVLKEIRAQAEEYKELELQAVKFTARKDRCSEHIVELCSKRNSFKAEKAREVQDLKSEIKQLTLKQEALDNYDYKTPLAEAVAAVDECKKKLAAIPAMDLGKLKKFREMESELKGAASTLQSQLSMAKKQLAALEARKENWSFGTSKKVCPTCRQTITEEHIKACQAKDMEEIAGEAEEVEEAIRAAKERLTVSAEAEEKVRGRLQELENEQNARYKLQNKLGPLQEELATTQERATRQKAKAQAYADKIEQLEEQLTEKEAAENPFDALIEKEREEETKYAEQLDTKTKEMVTSDKKAARLTIWKKGFSKEGIRSFIFDQYVPLLNKSAQEHLDILSNGLLRIELSPQKKNKDGSVREEFFCKVHNPEGGEDYEDCSAGERGWVDLAIIGGFNDYLLSRPDKGINLFFMDEVDGAYDEVSRQNLGDFVNHMAKKRRVFIISQHKDVSKTIRHRLMAVKANKVSTLKEA